MSPIPSHCTSKLTGRRVTLADPKTKAKLHIELREGVHTQIQVDGCISEITSKKCDWCLHIDCKQYAFFELKGSDYCHALAQLGNTIEWFKATTGKTFQLHSSHVVISGRGTPNTKSYKVRAKANFIQKYSCIPEEHRSGACIALASTL